MNKQIQYKVGVDWGSSSFRAYRFNTRCELTDSVSYVRGIKTVDSQQFESTLFELIGDWLLPGTQVLLSGMITSRNGWLETPYIEIPAKLDNLLDHAKTLSLRGVEFIFLPGLCQKHPRADVIRGEELQLFGATQQLSTTAVVMPGTHSKWATVQNSAVTRFQTIMTGELFDVLLHQTLVGQLADGHEYSEKLFIQGVHCGYQTNTLISELFQCRSGVLLNELNATDVHSYLSGLLIGHEVKEGISICKQTEVDKDTKNETPKDIVLIGSDKLCARYATAFETLKINLIPCESQTTQRAFGSLLAMI